MAVLQGARNVGCLCDNLALQKQPVVLLHVSYIKHVTPCWREEKGQTNPIIHTSICKSFVVDMGAHCSISDESIVSSLQRFSVGALQRQRIEQEGDLHLLAYFRTSSEQ